MPMDAGCMDCRAPESGGERDTHITAKYTVDTSSMVGRSVAQNRSPAYSCLVHCTECLRACVCVCATVRVCIGVLYVFLCAQHSSPTSPQLHGEHGWSLHLTLFISDPMISAKFLEVFICFRQHKVGVSLSTFWCTLVVYMPARARCRRTPHSPRMGCDSRWHGVATLQAILCTIIQLTGELMSPVK